VCELVECVVVEHSDQPVKVPERVADLIDQLAGTGGAGACASGRRRERVQARDEEGAAAFA